MAKKWYAMKYRNGKKSVVFGEWDSISKKIIGKKGVVFKGFPSESAAKEWINKDEIPFRWPGQGYNRDEIYVFVDGSYSSVRRCSGWGWVAVKNGSIIGEGWGVVENIKGSRNIVGELRGAQKAIAWAIGERHKSVTVVHDYAGIGNWALGYWKGSSDVAKEYIKFIGLATKHIKLKFEKVNGHCGIKWNDYADELTRRYQIGDSDEQAMDSAGCDQPDKARPS